MKLACFETPNLKFGFDTPKSIFNFVTKTAFFNTNLLDYISRTTVTNKQYFQTIMVGGDYQAVIPEGLCHYDDALPYENDDKLVWNPSQLKAEEVEAYLKKAAQIVKPPIPNGVQLRDDEQALYLLQQCGHSAEEALRRLKMLVPVTKADKNKESLWSEEECRNFESGIRTYGKNFYQIQQNKVCSPILQGSFCK